MLSGEFTSRFKIQSRRAPFSVENQNNVAICSLVLPHIESNSTRDPKNLQNWLFSWNSLTTIKAILTSEYFFVVHIKNSITNYIQICAKTPKFETPIFLFLRTHARGLFMDYSTRFPPPNSQLGEASLHSPDYMTRFKRYGTYH